MPPAHSRSHIPTQADAAKPAAGALNPNEFRAFKLIKREKLTHNTSLYRWVLGGGRSQPHAERRIAWVAQRGERCIAWAAPHRTTLGPSGWTMAEVCMHCGSQ